MTYPTQKAYVDMTSMILLGHNPIKSCWIPLGGDGIEPWPLSTNMGDLFGTNQPVEWPVNINLDKTHQFERNRCAWCANHRNDKISRRQWASVRARRKIDADRSGGERQNRLWPNHSCPRHPYHMGQVQKADKSDIAFHHHCFNRHDEQISDYDQANIGKKNKHKPMQEEFWKILVHKVFVILVHWIKIKKRRNYTQHHRPISG